MPRKLQVIFQGGGAKLVCLMAAAQAVYNLEKNGDIEVTKITGTSAGAIAAFFLASGKDPELFRQNMLTSAPSALSQIVKKRSTITNICRAILGLPLYDPAAYMKFLENLIKDVAAPAHISLLKPPSIFYSTDIENGCDKQYDGVAKQDFVAKSLFESSCLPFIFSTFKNLTFVDGGLINNFPSVGLSGSDGDIVGFTFKNIAKNSPREGFIAYCMAVLSTAIDVSVAKSIDSLPKENVFVINTNIDTFDFAEANVQLADNFQYSRYIESTKLDVSGFVAERDRKERAETERQAEEANAARERAALHKSQNEEIQTLRATITDYHRRVSASSQYRVLRKVFISTCNSLMGGEKQGRDHFTVRETILPITDVPAYGAVIVAGLKAIDAGKLNPRISKRVQGQLVDQIFSISPFRVTLDDTGLSGERPYNVMFFIDPPLCGGEGVTYDLEYSFSMDNILGEILEGLDDFFVLACTRDSDQFEIIFKVPYETMKGTEKSALSVELYPLEGTRRTEVEKRHFNGPQSWATGEPMDKGGLSHYESPPDMHLIGWKATNLKRGQAVGIRALGWS